VTLSRRDALKALAALSGAVALSHLPRAWRTPRVTVGSLPAHACVSSTPPFAEPGQIIASATWSPAVDGEIYLDIAVGDCEGIDFLETDSTDSGTGPLNVSAEGLADGSYVIDLDYYGTIPLTAAVTVTTEFGTTVFQGTIPADRLVLITPVSLPVGLCGGATFVVCDAPVGEDGGLDGRRAR
jgi:hypothetical protein